MVKRKLVIVVLLVLLIVPTILADTTINVKTLANHDVILKIIDPYPKEGESNILEFFENATDENGQVSFISYVNGIINIIVIVEKDGVRKKINNETIHEFNNKPTGGIINLEVKEKPPEPIIVPVVNESKINETENTTGAVDVQVEVTENETSPATETQTEEIGGEKEKGITGAAISGIKSVVTSKVTYYIIGGIFILGVLFFVVFIVRKKLKSGGHYIDFKIKEGKATESVSKQISDKRLAAAEKKLEEARKELDYIKNRKSRLEEVRKRFEESKKELERLERE